MSLVKYQHKRSFDETPEPKGVVKKTKQLPVFLIQKHDASHLHYDFRLEHRGVLLSWAVPKGPSLDQKEKRLAIQVEDHLFDYRNFEGIIPKGNYGAGTVMLWDEGTYTVKEETSKKGIEKAIDAGLKKGHLEFTLNGDKLSGSFSLIKLKGNDENHWLLIKGKDSSIKEKENWDRSVRTGRSLEEISGGIKKNKKKISKTQTS